MSLMSRARESKYVFLPNGNISIENAIIIWTNFEGRPTKFNPAGGKRTYSLVLSEEIAERLKQEGWNVKLHPAREEGDDDLFTTEIVVNMDSKYPPKMFLCSEFMGKKTMRRLSKESVGELDNAQLSNVDIVVHPYEHGREPYRVKGYTDTLYATMMPVNDFGGKYSGYGLDSEAAGEEVPW